MGPKGKIKRSKTTTSRPSKPSKPSEVMVMQIVTRYTTVVEFASSFRRFCGRGTCFIPNAQAKRIGIEIGFSIQLADRTPVLRGRCVVLESWTSAETPYECPGVLLGIQSLTPETKPFFEHLLLTAADRKPKFLELARGTAEMTPVNCADDGELISMDAIPELVGLSDDEIDEVTGRIEENIDDEITRPIEMRL